MLRNTVIEVQRVLGAPLKACHDYRCDFSKKEYKKQVYKTFEYYNKDFSRTTPAISSSEGVL